MGLFDKLKSALRASQTEGAGTADGAHRPSRGSGRKPDDVYGTGLWRQHRDRFARAVDRFYATAVAVHELTSPEPAATKGPVDGAPAGASPSDADASQAAHILGALTHKLNELADRVDTVSATAHARFRLDDLIVPAGLRAAVGTLPELVSRASGKVSEAAQTAAMARTALLRSAPAEALAAARSAERFVGLAGALVTDAERALGTHDSAPGAPTTRAGTADGEGTE